MPKLSSGDTDGQHGNKPWPIPLSLPGQWDLAQTALFGCSTNSDFCQTPSELKCRWHTVSQRDPTLRQCEGLGIKEFSPPLSSPSPVRGLTSPKRQISVPSKIFYSSEVQREQWNSHLLMLSSPTRLLIRAGGPGEVLSLVVPLPPLPLSFPCKYPLMQRTNIPPNLSTGKKLSIGDLESVVIFVLNPLCKVWLVFTHEQLKNYFTFYFSSHFLPP